MGFFSSRQKNSLKQDLKFNNDYGDGLKLALERISEGTATLVSENEVNNPEIRELLNKIISKNLSRKDELLHINNVLENIVQMVGVKVMVEGISEQSDTLQSMSASSEELSASVEDVAEMTQKASDMAS